MLWWAPFGADADLDPAMRGLDRARRCRLIADAYDLSAGGPQAVDGLAIANWASGAGT